MYLFAQLAESQDDMWYDFLVCTYDLKSESDAIGPMVVVRSFGISDCVTISSLELVEQKVSGNLEH